MSRPRPEEIARPLPERGFLASALLGHAEVLDRLLDAVEADFAEALRLLRQAFAHGGKVLICGNGGSAADAQHFAAELVGQPCPLPAVALTVDTSALTAVGNDYGYVHVFSRQVAALGRPGDVLVALSTSGESANVLEACEAAHRLGLKVVGLTGAGGQSLASRSHSCIRVPSHETPRIQEMHILVLHALWQGVRDSMPAIREVL